MFKVGDKVRSVIGVYSKFFGTIAKIDNTYLTDFYFVEYVFHDEVFTVIFTEKELELVENAADAASNLKVEQQYLFLNPT